MIFEYKVVRKDNLPHNNLTEVLNEYGKDEWELTMEIGEMLIFKRVAEEPIPVYAIDPETGNRIRMR